IRQPRTSLHRDNSFRHGFFGLGHVSRHRDRAAADWIDVQRDPRADDHVRLHVLSVGRPRTRAADEISRADQPARLRFGGHARLADPHHSTYAARYIAGCACRDLCALSLAGTARFSAAGDWLTSSSHSTWVSKRLSAFTYGWT